MSEQFNQAVFDAVSETLENMTFLEVTQGKKEQWDPQNSSVICVSLLINNPFPGEFKLRLPLELAQQMAEILYGMPAEETSETMLRDITAEVLNTVAGRIMTEILPGNQTYQLGLPEIDPVESSPGEEAAADWYLNVDENLIALYYLGEIPA